jgi:integrase
MGRRSNGEGTLFQRKDERWSAQAYVTLSNGTKKRICITGRDHNIVKTKLREALAKEHRKIPYIEKNWTVGEYLDYWIQNIQQNNIRETTMSLYVIAINKHIKPTMGGHKLSSLSVQNVREAMNMLEKKGCPGPMRHKCLRILSACITCAMREDLVFRNVAQLVEKPKYTPKETIIWTAEQAALFLQAVKEHPQYIAFLLLMTYGMRRGEVLGLRWCDIDFDNGFIHVRQQIDRINGVIKARDLKTKNSRRTPPLIDDVRNALIECAKKRSITITKFNPQLELTTQDTIVISGAGTPLDPKNLTRCFHKLSDKLRLPRIKIHDMRHIAATLLKDAGTPVRDAQLILGHANSTTTMNIYQHGTSELQRAALSAVHERLFEKSIAQPNT